MLASQVMAGKVRRRSVGGRTVSRSWPQQCLGLCRSRLFDGLRVAGGVTARSGCYLDDVPARVMLDLAPWRAAGQRSTGVQLVRRYRCSIGGHQVSSADVVVGLPMRCVFADRNGFPSPSRETISADRLIRSDIAGSGCVWTTSARLYRHRGHASAGAALMGESGSFRIACTHSGSHGSGVPFQRQPGELPQGSLRRDSSLQALVERW